MSSSASKFSRPEAGSHTVEGNKAGSRAAMLEKERQRAAEDFERRKQEIASQRTKTALSFQSSDGNFQTSKSSSVEESFRAKTVGLVSADDFVKAQMEASRQEQLLEEEEFLEPKVPERPIEDKKTRKKRKKEKKKMMSTLSFGNELMEEEEEADNDMATLSKRSKTLKDPTVDTSFLPDQQRDAEERAERIRLMREWKEAQKVQREQPLQVVYSYWDGSGHRKTVVVKQGNTIGEFLQKVLEDLIPQFRQLAGLTSDDLLYVKEDLILPSDITFYDLIATKARGKSGPLFSFDVHDDIRIGPNDVRVEKDDSHPGKVVERRWYERSKHIFPASRWEFYDPTKEYGKYTIGGKIVQPPKK
jgi:protein FAM50